MSTEETLVNLDFNGTNHNTNDKYQLQQHQIYNIKTNQSSAHDISNRQNYNKQHRQYQQESHHQQPLISSVALLTSDENNYSSIDAPIQYHLNDCDVDNIAHTTLAPTNLKESVIFTNRETLNGTVCDNRNSLISLSSNSSSIEETRNFCGGHLSIDTDCSLPDATHEIIMESRESQPLLGRDAHEYFHNNFTGNVNCCYIHSLIN